MSKVPTKEQLEQAAKEASRVQREYMGLEPMTQQSELRELLTELRSWIINYAESVIGEDEKVPEPNYIPSAINTRRRNELRAEQRKRVNDDQ